MQQASLGVVGCDDLNEYRATPDPNDPPSVWYWPRLWVGDGYLDTFTYATYGGEATVTIRFTDRAPVATDIVRFDPGAEHTVAGFGSPQESRSLYCHFTLGCYYFADYSRLSGDWVNDHHAGSVSLAAVRDSDPDGDASRIIIVDGHNPHLRGASAVVTETGTSTETNYSHWRTDETAPHVTCFVSWFDPNPPCLALSHDQRFAGFNEMSPLRPVNPLDGSTPTTRGDCVATTDTIHSLYLGYGTPSTGDYPTTLNVWSSAADTDPGCVPSVPDDCSDAAMLADWSMCYSLWPNAANPAPHVVDYRVCDARREAARSDTAFTEHLAPFVAPAVPHLSDSQVAHLIGHWLAGNVGRPIWGYSYTPADWDAVVAAADAQLGARYCDEGTITVLLGDTSTVSMQPTATATEGLSLGFVVTLDQRSAVDVTVTFSTQPDTAGTDPAEASDYRARTDAQVTIPAGQTQAPAEVLTVQDSIYENDETLRVVVTAADAARLGADLEAVGTIVNDDSQPVVGFAADATADEDIWLFAFQGGVRVSRSVQLGLPA